jgi:hypothetical protein
MKNKARLIEDTSEILLNLNKELKKEEIELEKKRETLRTMKLVGTCMALNGACHN